VGEAVELLAVLCDESLTSCRVVGHRLTEGERVSGVRER
jgi:hypothetical protein